MGRSNQSDKIYEQLRSLIVSREYPAGSLLPKELELAPRFGVSRGTIRAALDRLETENLIERIKRKGTVVSYHADEMPMILFTGEMILSLFGYRHLIAAGAERRANEHGCVLEQIHPCYLDGAIGNLNKRDIRGIIYAGTNFNGDEPVIDLLKSTGLKIVLAHGRAEDLAVTGFDAGNYTSHARAIHMALDHFQSLGHRRCAYFGTLRQGTFADENGLWDALAARNMACDPALYHPANPESKDIRQTLERLHQSGATAVLAGSDAFAVELYKFCHAKRIRIPHDLSVMALGGNIGGEFLTPSLTVIDYGYAHMGSLAVEQLFSVNEQKLIETPVSLTIRKSCQYHQGGR